jgi:hypothetical protein
MRCHLIFPGILLGAIFPLFTSKMFKALTYRWANMMFAGFALLLMPIPFVRTPLLACLQYSIWLTPGSILQVLFFYGPALRQRSEFSRQMLEAPTIVQPPTNETQRDAEKQESTPSNA